MYTLRNDEEVCATCPSPDCLLKCQYMDLDKEQAHKEMMKLVRGEDSRVLQECVTCYGCEEYCKRGNHPYYLICERREERGILTTARPITNQWINVTSMQGKFKIGEVKDTVMSCCFVLELREMGRGKLFEEIEQSFVFGAEFMCPALLTHFAQMTLLKERFPVKTQSSTVVADAVSRPRAPA